jgi:addiction module HigA family antidote
MRLTMSSANRINRKIRPTHPGEMLREDFIAETLGVSRQTMNELLREHRSLTPLMALRLSRLFGNSPEFWLNAQRAVDLWDAQNSNRDEIKRIRPLKAA